MSQFGTELPPPLPRENVGLAGTPQWPKVVGIISIVWSSFGLICNGCNTLGGAVGRAMVGALPPESRGPLEDQLKTITPFLMVVYVLLLLLAGLLLAAGISTLRRRPLGRGLHLAYGGAGVVIGVLRFIASMPAIQQKIATMQHGAQDSAHAAGMQVGAYIGAGCVSLVGVLYPLFCLYWFGLMGNRPEQGAMPRESLL